MKQIFVAKDAVAYASNGAAGTIAGIAEINSLEEGAIAVLDETGALIAGSEESLTTEFIQFATKKNGVPLLSRQFFNPMTYVKATYVAPVAKIMCIGSNTDNGTTYNLNLPATPVAGTSAQVMVIDREKRHDDKSRERIYEYVVKAGDTAATIEAGIIAKINADTLRIVDALEVDATGHDGFKLTARTAGHDFMVVCGGILINADVLEYKNIVRAGTAGLVQGYTAGLTTLVVNNNKGRGTAAQIRAMEVDFSPMDGNGPNVKETMPLHNFPPVAVTGKTYVDLVMTSKQPNDNFLMPKSNMTYELHVAVPAGLFDAGEAGTLLNTIIELFKV